jgi:hypothetical protein
VRASPEGVRNSAGGRRIAFVPPLPVGRPRDRVLVFMRIEPFSGPIEVLNVKVTSVYMDCPGDRLALRA